MSEQDSFKEVTTEGFGKRILDSIKGVAFGFLLFLGSFALLWWNEGKLVSEKAVLKEMGDKVQSVASDKPSEKYDQRLIHTSGHLSSEDRIQDNLQLLKPGPWLKIRSKVEMYQWIEESKSESTTNVGGSKTTETTYRYKLDWAEGRVDSSKFKKPTGHENPRLALEAGESQASEAFLGRFEASEILEALDPDQVLTLKKEMLADPASGRLEGGTLFITRGGNGNNSSRDQKLNSGNAQLGDIRVSFSVLKPLNVSVIGTQVRKGSDQLYGIQSYRASNNSTKLLVEKETMSAEAMLTSARESAQTMTMVLRFVGFLIMAIGISMCLNPLATLSDVLPFIGTLSRGVIGIISFVSASVLSAVTIVIAMIFHNPLILAIFVLCSVAGTGFLIWRKSQKKRLLAGNTTDQKQVKHAA